MQATQDLAAGDSGIDEQPGTGAGDKRAIPLAAAGQHRYRDCHNREHTRKQRATVVTKSSTIVDFPCRGIAGIGKNHLSFLHKKDADAHTIYTGSGFFCL
jgi:hypothetical protein